MRSIENITLNQTEINKMKHKKPISYNYFFIYQESSI